MVEQWNLNHMPKQYQHSMNLQNVKYTVDLKYLFLFIAHFLCVSNLHTIQKQTKTQTNICKRNSFNHSYCMLQKNKKYQKKN